MATTESLPGAGPHNSRFHPRRHGHPAEGDGSREGTGGLARRNTFLVVISVRPQVVIEMRLSVEPDSRVAPKGSPRPSQ